MDASRSDMLGVVDYINLLSKLTEEARRLMLLGEDSVAARQVSTEAPAVLTALRAVLDAYQPSLHGRAAVTVMSINVAAATVRHFSQVLLNLLVESGASEERCAVALLEHDGKLLNQKKALLHVGGMSAELVGEWMNQCPTFLLTSSAGVLSVESEQSFDDRVPGSLAEVSRVMGSRRRAFDVAVLAYGISSKVRFVDEYLAAINLSCMAESSLVDPRSVFPALSALDASVDEWKRLCLPVLERVYWDVAVSLMLAGDTPDAVAWLCMANQLAHELGLAMRSPAASSPDGTNNQIHASAWRCGVIEILNVARHCQSSDMLFQFIARISCVAERTGGNDDGRMTAACVVCRLATEHCASLLLSSQIVMELCDRATLRTSGSPCPACNRDHSVDVVCDVSKQKRCLLVCDTLRAALALSLNASESTSPQLSAFVGEACAFLVNLQKTLPQSSVFSRVHETEVRQLERQLNPAANFPASNCAPLRSTASRWGYPILASSRCMDGSIEVTPQRERTSSSLLLESRDLGSLTFPQAAHSGLLQTEERAADDLFLLRPPVNERESLKVLEQIAVMSASNQCDLEWLLSVCKSSTQNNVCEGDNHWIAALQQLDCILRQRGASSMRLERNKQELRSILADGDGLIEMLLTGLEDITCIVERQNDWASGQRSVEVTSHAAEAAPEVVAGDLHVIRCRSAPLLRHWSRVPKNCKLRGAQKRHRLSEPRLYFQELHRAVSHGQHVLSGTAHVESTAEPHARESGPVMSERMHSADELKRLVGEFSSPLHGKAPSTLAIVSTACAVAARLIREERHARRRQQQRENTASSQDGLQALAVAEAELWNQATKLQKVLLGLAHLEPVSRCALYIERGVVFFSQSMWLASANEFAVAEKILVSRRDAVCSGLRRLAAYSHTTHSSVEAFLKRYEAIMPKAVLQHFAARHRRIKKSAQWQLPQEAGESEAASVKLLEGVISRVQYNVATCLWSAGHADVALEWLTASEVAATPSRSPVSRAPESLSTVVTVLSQLCRLVTGPLADVGGILMFLGKLSSFVAEHPAAVAGALILVQHVVEHYLSERVCSALAAAAKARNDATMLVSLDAQSRVVAATCNELVGQLSSGRLSNLPGVLRDGLPPSVASWDKMLLHSIVTCMNFCSAFPDSVWYDAALRTRSKLYEDTEAALAQEASKPESSSLAAAASGLFSGLTRRLSTLMHPNISRQPDEATASEKAARDTSVAALFLDSSAVLNVMEWILTVPVIAVREEDVRIASIALDEAFIDIRNTLASRCGPEVAQDFVQQHETEAAAAIATLANSFDDVPSAGCRPSGLLSAKGCPQKNGSVCPRPSSLSSSFSKLSVVDAPDEEDGDEEGQVASPYLVVANIALYTPSVTVDKLAGEGRTHAQGTAAPNQGVPWGRVYSPTLPSAHDQKHVNGEKSLDLVSAASLLSAVQRQLLHNELPMHHQLQPWRTIYSTNHHGHSYRQLLANCDNEAPVLLCIAAYDATSNSNGIFGALIPTGIRTGSQKFYGGNTTFVFQFSTNAQNSDCIAVFRWTHANEYFVNCRADHLAIGGGSSGAAIYLEETLATGSTARCETFDSPPLLRTTQQQTTSDTAVQFDVAAIEVYAIGLQNNR